MLRRLLTILVAVFVVIAIALYVLGPSLHSFVRSRTARLLQTHFESQIEFSDFQVSLFPRFEVTVTGLVMHHKGRTDIPPLIQIQRVAIYAHLLSLLQPRPHIALVRLVGLQINTPPREPGGTPLVQGTDQDLQKKYPILIEQILADDAVISVLKAQSNKPPRIFAIHHLLLRDLSFDRPAKFVATLTNAVPKGEIDAVGDFGPWLPSVPRETPATGRYTFLNADLGTLKGIKGILSSKGTFNGPLDYLKVDGETDVPDFALRIAEHPVALHTEYSSIVDGTNGDTYLNSVTATFLHTTIHVSGKVVDVSQYVKGRTIVLDATSTDARVEDLIRLVAKGADPVMTGSVKLRTKINIPEGPSDLIERLKLAGQFGIDDANFTKPRVQGKIDTLSRKGQGQPKDLDISHVDSDMKGSFQVKDGVADFSDLSFSVTGASVNLAGTYNLDTGGLDFYGKLILQAKPSQTTTGVKSFLLKAVDPFLKGKHAGTVLPIKITGTKSSPSFGLDFHRRSD